jgi:hypothetical protein
VNFQEIIQKEHSFRDNSCKSDYKSGSMPLIRWIRVQYFLCAFAYWRFDFFIGKVFVPQFLEN